MDEIKIIVRGPEPTDKDFIMATWLKGNRFGSPYFERQDPAQYYRDYANQITDILVDPDTAVTVACDAANPSWIVGYAVYSGPVLYWTHIKEDYRRKGIATLLLKDTEITTVKGLTKLGWSIIQKKGLIFDPRQRRIHGS